MLKSLLMKLTANAPDDTEEKEEAAQPLRRMEEEEAQALRREEEEEAAQPLRRVAPEGMNAENSEHPEELAQEPESPDLRALHRDIAAGIDGAGAGAGFAPDMDPVGTSPFAPAQQAFQRPQVQIDQLDVLIHEPAAAASAARGPDRTRSIRARYLRRL